MASMIPRLPKAGSEACNPSEVNKGVQGPELDVDACTQDNIRVVVRVRPASGPTAMALTESQSIRLHQDGVAFTVDGVLDHCSSQSDVFEAVGVPLVEHVLNGYNSTCAAYGMTSSGKTHTMQGSLEPGDQQRGLIPRMVQRLLDSLQAMSRKDGVTYILNCSYYELYNEHITDLLQPSTEESLQVRVHPRNGPFIERLSAEQVTTVEEVAELMHRGAQARTVAATLLNSESSRSHAVFQLHIELRSQPNEHGIRQISRPRLTLVDLAGSERAKMSGASGLRLKEATNINLSLSTLGRCIRGIVRGDDSVPFRESKLTHLLQDSLGGNSKTVLVCTVSPAAACSQETAMTLEFAATAKLVKTHALRRVEADGDPAALRRAMQRLAAENAELRGGQFRAALDLARNELAASNEAGARLAEELAGMEAREMETRERLEEARRDAERLREQVVEAELQCAADLQEAQQAATQAAASAAAQSALTEAQAAQALEATEERHAAQQHASNAELQNVEQRAATELDELREHIQRLTADVAATQNSAAEAAAELALVAGCHVTDKAASDAEVAAMAARLHECQQQAAAAAEEHNTAAFALSDRLATAERQAAEYRSLLQTAQAEAAAAKQWAEETAVAHEQWMEEAREAAAMEARLAAEQHTAAMAQLAARHAAAAEQHKAERLCDAEAAEGALCEARAAATAAAAAVQQAWDDDAEMRNQKTSALRAVVTTQDEELTRAMDTAARLAESMAVLDDKHGKLQLQHEDVERRYRELRTEFLNARTQSRGELDGLTMRLGEVEATYEEQVKELHRQNDEAVADHGLALAELGVANKELANVNEASAAIKLLEKAEMQAAANLAKLHAADATIAQLTARAKAAEAALASAQEAAQVATAAAAAARERAAVDRAAAQVQAQAALQQWVASPVWTPRSRSLTRHPPLQDTTPSQGAPPSARRVLQPLQSSTLVKPAAAARYSQALKPAPSPLTRVTRGAARKRAADGAAGDSGTPSKRAASMSAASEGAEATAAVTQPRPAAAAIARSAARHKQTAAAGRVLRALAAP